MPLRRLALSSLTRYCRGQGDIPCAILMIAADSNRVKHNDDQHSDREEYGLFSAIGNMLRVFKRADIALVFGWRIKTSGLRI